MMTYYPTAVVINTHKNDDVLAYSGSYKHHENDDVYPTAVVINTPKNDDVLSHSCSYKHSQE